MRIRVWASKVSGEGRDSISGPVVGYVADDAISFSVKWPGDEGSITSWVGQIVIKDGGAEELDTLWHLIVSVPDATDPKSTWRTIHAGADAFHR